MAIRCGICPFGTFSGFRFKVITIHTSFDHIFTKELKGNFVQYQSHFDPKGGKGGSYEPAAQKIACHFLQDHVRVLKLLNFFTLYVD